MQSKITERAGVVGKIDPVSLSASTALTDAIDMSKFRRVLFTISVGAMTATGTLDFAIHQSDASGGSYAAISGKSITQLTAAGSDSNKVVEIEIRADELTEGKRFIKGSLTAAVAASIVSVVAHAFDARYEPVSPTQDLAAVDEIVE